MNRDELLAAITEKYLSSEEFNGYPLGSVELPSAASDNVRPVDHLP
jgi:hypothetical protein